jgi:DNA replication initiation complex subunit (GINS family)
MEIDFTSDIQAAQKGKAPLNKPFRLPSGSKKKFGVYVKNDKGNIIKVTFGDPNMSIKRDNPERRKAYRARHGCDNPGPKWKANYWSCKMWSAKPVSKITGSEEEVTFEIDVQAKNKGLWYNIQQKKKRMGKNYRPAKPGSPDRPSKDAFKKAQGEEYEWDGETEFDQAEFLKLDPSLAQAEETPEEELQEYKDDFYGMIVGSITSIQANAQNILNKLNDPMVKENLTEPFLQQMAALAEDYMITIHNYVMFNKEDESVASAMFQVGDKVKNINAMCKHYGSEGTVKEIRDLPEDMGYGIVYECSNNGPTWKIGDILGKTEIQLKKI